jgi:hypothetical protein
LNSGLVAVAGRFFAKDKQIDRHRLGCVPTENDLAVFGIEPFQSLFGAEIARADIKRNFRHETCAYLTQPLGILNKTPIPHTNSPHLKRFPTNNRTCFSGEPTMMRW